MTAAGKKIGNDLFVISWFVETSSYDDGIFIKKLNETDSRLSSSCKLMSFGSQTKTLNLVLSKLLSSSAEKEENELLLPTVTVTNEQCVLMTPTKSILTGRWIWKASFKCNTPFKCENGLYPSNCCTHRSNYNFQILIHFTQPLCSIGEGEKNVLNHLSKLLEDQTLSDVTFQVQGESIKAHSILVAAGSPVLAAMFEQNFIEKHTRVIKIQDIKAPVFKQLLQYMYTGKASEIGKEDIARDLLVAADKYGVESLKEECIKILIENLNSSNAIPILILAHLHSAPILLQATLSFMSLNGKGVCSHSIAWKQLMKNYPDLCYTATKHIVGF